MVFGAIYNYLTGTAEEEVATTVPVRSVEPIDHDWELIETDSEKSQNETAELKPKEPSTNASRVQRRKNTKKISEWRLFFNGSFFVGELHFIYNITIILWIQI